MNFRYIVFVAMLSIIGGTLTGSVVGSLIGSVFVGEVVSFVSSYYIAVLLLNKN